jgi:hypothetical protein
MRRRNKVDLETLSSQTLAIAPFLSMFLVLLGSLFPFALFAVVSLFDAGLALSQLTFPLYLGTFPLTYSIMAKLKEGSTIKYMPRGNPALVLFKLAFNGPSDCNFSMADRRKRNERKTGQGRQN